jgi:hypothetical protein
VIILRSSAPTPALWTFFDFCYVSGGTPIQDWYDALSDRGQLQVDNLLKNNQKIDDHSNWVGFRKYLKGGEMRGQKIWELGFFDDRQYRLLGMFNGSKRAIFLMGCYHKGGNYTPPTALGTALTRKNMLQKGQCELHERKIRIDR